MINDTVDASQGDHDIHSYTEKYCSPQHILIQAEEQPHTLSPTLFVR